MSASDEPNMDETLYWADETEMGAYVYFERSDDGRMLVRCLKEWDVKSFRGKMYRVECGAKPNTVRLRGVPQEERP